MKSAFSPWGRTWLKSIASPRCIPSTATKTARTDRYLPHTYSPGVSGVEWRISPTRCSSSRMMDMPAATEMKNT